MDGAFCRQDVLAQLERAGAEYAMPSSAARIQLKSGNGFCWDAEYSAPALKNDHVQFRDKSD